jgi:hypothetical protein
VLISISVKKKKGRKQNKTGFCGQLNLGGDTGLNPVEWFSLLQELSRLLIC